MKEEWLFPGAIVPLDVETTAALVAEIKRLIDVVGSMALAQSEQEPVGYEFKWTNPGANPDVSLEELDWKPVTHRTFQTVQECIKELLAYRYKDVPVYEVRALYTTPPQRQWVGLTDEEAAECWSTSAVSSWKAIEAKLKEMNT